MTEVFDAGLGSVHPTAGELLHAGQVVPQEQHGALFGIVDTSSFQGLGLAAPLAIYLEGMLDLPWNMVSL